MDGNLKSRIKTTFVLLVDFVGFIIIFFIVIFALNYFKILPLSKIFPTTLGWLPEKQTIVEKIIPTPNTSNLNIWHQADQALITNYSDYFKTHSATTSSEILANGSIEESVFIGYNNYLLQVLTPQRRLMFKVSNNTQFYKISPSLARNGTILGENRKVNAYKDYQEFIQNVPFGSFLTIKYKMLKDTNAEILTIDYFPEHKF